MTVMFLLAVRQDSFQTWLAETVPQVWALVLIGAVASLLVAATAAGRKNYALHIASDDL